MTTSDYLFSLKLETGAEFSPCRTWRYALWRIWDERLSNCMFIGLNPSTADETNDDPTIRRCINFCKLWGFGGYIMMNAYAFRATDPRDMKAATDPIGPGNDDAFMRYRNQASMIVAAWGVHCDPLREQAVCDLLKPLPVYCLGRTKDGRPKHPLYLRADTRPEIFLPAKTRKS